MRNIIIGLVVVLMVGWAIFEFTGEKSEEKQLAAQRAALLKEQQQLNAKQEAFEGFGIKVGDMAPNFEVQDLATGEQVKLTDYQGEPVILNFWATWCPPCRAEMPDMEQFFKDTDANLLSVNLIETEKSKEHVPEFIDSYGLTFDVLLDHNSATAATYKIQPIPTTFFIDREGVISFIAYGAMNYDTMVQEYEKIK